MNNIGRKFEIFVIVVIIAAFGIIYAFTRAPKIVKTSENNNNSEQVVPSGQTSVRPDFTDQPTPPQEIPQTTIEYKGVDGKNALDILKANHQVGLKHYSYGDMVESIDGITPDSKHFWALYVNGQFSQIGASSVNTKSSDTIKWQVDALVDPTR